MKEKVFRRPEMMLDYNRRLGGDTDRHGPAASRLGTRRDYAPDIPIPGVYPAASQSLY